MLKLQLFIETVFKFIVIRIFNFIGLQEVPSNISSVRTSPTDSLFGDSSNLKDLNDSFVEIYSDIESRNSEMVIIPFISQSLNSFIPFF